MAQNYKRLKLACYTTNISMSVVSNLSPLLFLTFRNLYGISYTLLGLLVLINFFTQLLIDLAFSFFSHKFNISLSVKITPCLTVIGLLIYAITPFFLPKNLVYLGLAAGTVVFSASGGLAEVLISPVIAEIPADEPEHEMSKLHSIYAWGVVAVVIISTLFIHIFKSEMWQWLAIILSLIPLFAALLFAGVDIPKMKTPEKASGAFKMLKNGGIWLSVLAIFLGGAAECTMAQWCSSYIEKALGVSKLIGDIFGVALFAIALGFGRTLYSKIGKNIYRVLILGSLGAAICYFVAAISNIEFIGLIACAVTGFCVSMLWPGSLIVASNKFPSGGVFIFALMAAGGDLGASVGPQLVGVITDTVIASDSTASIAAKLGLTAEQFGMKAGMLCGMLFPLIAVFVFIAISKIFKKEQK